MFYTIQININLLPKRFSKRDLVGPVKYLHNITNLLHQKNDLIQKKTSHIDQTDDDMSRVRVGYMLVTCKQLPSFTYKGNSMSHVMLYRYRFILSS